jgi:hypothetical protein
VKHTQWSWQLTRRRSCGVGHMVQLPSNNRNMPATDIVSIMQLPGSLSCTCRFVLIAAVQASLQEQQ